MQINDTTLLCRYHYDPLDRLSRSQLTAQTITELFYNRLRLATEVKGNIRHSFIQQGEHLLAQRTQHSKGASTALLATDEARSAINEVEGNAHHATAFTPYGHRPSDCELFSLLGFKGEHAAPITGHYLLGNGYRAFNPVLMRFNSPDTLSPFREGGINSYTYCANDPINYKDDTGHFKVSISGFLKRLGILNNSYTGRRPFQRAIEDYLTTNKFASGQARETTSDLQGAALQKLSNKDLYYLDKEFPNTNLRPKVDAEIEWRTTHIYMYGWSPKDITMFRRSTIDLYTAAYHLKGGLFKPTSRVREKALANADREAAKRLAKKFKLHKIPYPLYAEYRKIIDSADLIRRKK